MFQLEVSTLDQKKIVDLKRHIHVHQKLSREYLAETVNRGTNNSIGERIVLYCQPLLCVLLYGHNNVCNFLYFTGNKLKTSIEFVSPVNKIIAGNLVHIFFGNRKT